MNKLNNITNLYKQAANFVSNADALIITAGAGMGVDSGLPDFRGNKGFWKAYPAIAHLGISFVEMANPRWFADNPKLAWAFYGHRYNLYKKTNPHKGFEILKKIGQQKEYGYFVYTSNVDGHFQKAGFNEAFIEEVHGSINYLQCSIPCNTNIYVGDKLHIEIDEKKFEAYEPLPHCPECGAVARPNILMFGDWNWLSHRSEEQSNRFENYIYNLKKQKAKPVIIEIGAGTAVPTVRLKSERLASEFETTLIRINPRDFHIPHYVKGIEIPAGALEGIFGIANEIN
ncbi:MAG: NAD-dependent deacetylase [Chlorobi bacterium]|nr:NAD-dependent deacetylase [Chlorobiota bacterium]